MLFFSFKLANAITSTRVNTSLLDGCSPFLRRHQKHFYCKQNVVGDKLKGEPLQEMCLPLAAVFHFRGLCRGGGRRHYDPGCFHRQAETFPALCVY